MCTSNTNTTYTYIKYVCTTHTAVYMYVHHVPHHVCMYTLNSVKVEGCVQYRWVYGTRYCGTCTTCSSKLHVANMKH